MRNVLLTTGLILLTLGAVAQKQDAILGEWLTEGGKSRISIYKDQAGKFHGRIVWLRDPLNEEGIPKRDKNNPDPALRTRGIIGMAILRDFVYDDGEWTDGKVYDPENGKEYSCIIRLDENKTLRVRGYVGVSWLGRTTVWTR